MDVDFTDADMDDPELLAELAAVMGHAPPVPDTAARRARLEAQVKAKRQEALRLKAFDKTAAVKALREAKTLEAELQTISSAASATVPPAPAPSRAAAQPVAAAEDASVDRVRVTDEEMDDPELNAELLAITGGPVATPAAGAQPVKPPSAPRRDQSSTDDQLASLVASMSVAEGGHSGANPTPPTQRKASSHDAELDALIASMNDTASARKTPPQVCDMHLHHPSPLTCITLHHPAPLLAQERMSSVDEVAISSLVSSMSEDAAIGVPCACTHEVSRGKVSRGK